MNSEELAWRIRRHAIDMVHASHASHIGAILSVTDIIAVLYAGVMRYDPKNPTLKTRDRLVLSKGHAGVAIYAALAECGFFPLSELDHYYENGGKLSGHVSHKGVPGVELSTGSLGHGAAVACGLALSAQMRGDTHHVYAVVGDGECNEGSIWEMALTAAQYKLSGFTVIVDHNGMQAMGRCDQVMAIEPLADKWRSFGWQVTEVDGHDHEALREALAPCPGEKPHCVIARTVKGKGVSFMENELLWHYRDPQGDDYDQAVYELEVNHH